MLMVSYETIMRKNTAEEIHAPIANTIEFLNVKCTYPMNARRMVQTFDLFAFE